MLLIYKTSYAKGYFCHPFEMCLVNTILKAVFLSQWTTSYDTVQGDLLSCCKHIQTVEPQPWDNLHPECVFYWQRMDRWIGGWTKQLRRTRNQLQNTRRLLYDGVLKWGWSYNKTRFLYSWNFFREFMSLRWLGSCLIKWHYSLW